MEIIAKEFDISESEVVYIMDSSNNPISLFTTVGDDSGKEQYLIDKIEDENPLDKQLDNELLYSIIKELPVRDKKIIICGHESPDVDSTSSQFALQFLLQKLGIREVYSVKQEDFL